MGNGDEDGTMRMEEKVEGATKNQDRGVWDCGWRDEVSWCVLGGEFLW